MKRIFKDEWHFARMQTSGISLLQVSVVVLGNFAFENLEQFNPKWIVSQRIYLILWKVNFTYIHYLLTNSLNLWIPMSEVKTVHRHFGKSLALLANYINDLTLLNAHSKQLKKSSRIHLETYFVPSSSNAFCIASTYLYCHYITLFTDSLVTTFSFKQHRSCNNVLFTLLHTLYTVHNFIYISNIIQWNVWK